MPNIWRVFRNISDCHVSGSVSTEFLRSAASFGTLPNYRFDRPRTILVNSLRLLFGRNGMFRNLQNPKIEMANMISGSSEHAYCRQFRL